MIFIIYQTIHSLPNKRKTLSTRLRKCFWYNSENKRDSGLFFFYLSFLSRPFTGKGKGKGIFLTPHYHFHPLHRHLDISREITAGSSLLHVGSSRTRFGNFWFPSASR